MTRTPLDRLRLQLTAWYLVTLIVIVLLLGGGLFLAIRRQFVTQLDDSLHDATVELERAAQIREQEAGVSGNVVDAVDELHIPDRVLFLLDAGGHPVKPDTAAEWIRDAARRAASLGTLVTERDMGDDKTLRVRAERFALQSGAPMVAVALADKIELEERYSSLIAAFGAAALVALILVSGGGWLLVRKSTAPIERSVDQMRRFMADAAHELRTPLTVLRSRAEIALQQPRDREAYVDALHGIEAESQRLGRIVDDLLTLARADAGERAMERSRVYLDDIVMDAAEAARVVAAGTTVTLTVEEYEEAVVQGDASLLRQLVMILLDNAIKFTPSGGRVTVRVNATHGKATLVVEDTGSGISPERLPHVFERFYRGDPARSRDTSGKEQFSGAGLGLAIAQWIVTEHHAAMEVSSDLGVGTRVVVWFPDVAEERARGVAASGGHT